MNIASLNCQLSYVPPFHKREVFSGEGEVLNVLEKLVRECAKRGD